MNSLSKLYILWKFRLVHLQFTIWGPVAEILASPHKFIICIKQFFFCVC